jgi:magnesium transporter
LVLTVVRKDIASLDQDMTVRQALDAIRLQGVGEKIVYFYVTDAEDRLIGVLPTRRLLTAPLDKRLEEVMIKRVVAPLKAFRFRFPWLLATITSGTLCAILASVYEATLAKSIVLAFFLTLVLGLAEGVSIQSMTVTIQALRTERPSLRWYAKAFRR